MYYSYVEIEYVATSFSPARTDLALKLLKAKKAQSLTLWLLQQLIMQLAGSKLWNYLYPSIKNYYSGW